MSQVFKFNLLLSTVLLATMLAIAPFLGFSWPEPSSLVAPAFFGGTFGAVGLIYVYLRPDKKVATFMFNLVVIVVYMSGGIIMSYLLVGMNLPLVDAQLSAIDRALGFDWPALIETVSRYPWIADASTFFYKASMLFMMVMLFYLGATNRIERVEEYVMLLIVAGILNGVIAGLLPAAGGYVHYNPAQELVGLVTPMTDAAYMNDFFAIRDGGIRQLSIGGSKGLMTFPSFHTVFSLIMVFALRGTGWVFAFAVVFNLGIIASTPIDGGHHFIDVIAAFGLALVAIAITVPLARWLKTRAPIPQMEGALATSGLKLRRASGSGSA
ncbi:MAG: phosphatase PAP2 family protein [Methyloligellaceae bacterium]